MSDIQVCLSMSASDWAKIRELLDNDTIKRIHELDPGRRPGRPKLIIPDGSKKCIACRKIRTISEFIRLKKNREKQYVTCNICDAVKKRLKSEVINAGPSSPNGSPDTEEIST